MNDHKDAPAFSEWLVGVKWDKTFDREQAKRFQGIFDYSFDPESPALWNARRPGTGR
jgi:hypothetical protein